MASKENALSTYLVRVGHWQIRLEAHNADEAIALARRHLSREMPRLYDLIRELTASRFQVENAA